MNLHCVKGTSLKVNNFHLITALKGSIIAIRQAGKAI